MSYLTLGVWLNAIKKAYFNLGKVLKKKTHARNNVYQENRIKLVAVGSEIGRPRHVLHSQRYNRYRYIVNMLNKVQGYG